VSGATLPFEVLDAYASLLDRKRTSMRDYLESRNVETEDGQLKAFKLRPFQLRLVEMIEETWNKGHAFYGIIIKAGQLGYSTLIEYMLAEGLESVPGCKELTVAHDVDSTVELFSKVDFAANQTPREVHEHTGRVRQNSSGTRIRFRHYGVPREENRYRVSSCRMMTARKRQGARSGTFNRMHLSEYAHWEDLTRIDAFIRSVHDEAGNFLLVETTAFGRNAAYELWNDAVAGRGELVPIFTAWWEHDRYSRKFKSPKEKAEFIESLGRTDPWRYGGREELDLFQGKIGYVLRGMSFGFAPLTAEQLHWRRLWIDNKCRGSLGLFHQEMPSFPEEAFQFSGLPVFNTAKLKGYERAAEAMEGGLRRVRLEWDPDYLALGGYDECPVKMIDDPHGWLTVLEEVESGAKCVGGVDIAEGLVTLPGGNDTDFTAGYIADWLSGQRYVRYNEKTEPDEAAEHWFMMSRFYGDAWIMPESNGPGLAFIKLAERMGFKRFLNRPRTEKTAEGDGTIEMRPGFKSTRSSKSWLISLARTRVEELPDADDDATRSPIDALLLRQQLAYVKSGKGTLAAERGKHDDLVVGDALTELARDQATEGMLSEVQPDMTETVNFMGKVAMHPLAEEYDPSTETEGEAS